MRIPKYKAYVKELNIVLNVATIYWSIDGKLGSVNVTAIDVDEVEFDFKRYDIDEVELMQCTGLKDKNGVEIHVGNIVRYPGGIDETLIAEIVYDEKYCKVQVRTFLSSYYDEDYDEECDEFLDLDNWTTIEHFEVIGNIYQNKELLEERE